MPELEWLASGRAGLEAILEAIDSATDSVCLETYIFSANRIGDRTRDALVRACRRGVRVRVLLDALGSFSLPRAYFEGLLDAGGEVRMFNPLNLRRLMYRNHRKLLTCDDRVAIIGGFNISDEYHGDGVESGWRDLGMRVRGARVRLLVKAFFALYDFADFHPKTFNRLRRAGQRRQLSAGGVTLLLGGPGRGPNPLKQALLNDMSKGASIRIASAYFLPTWGLRRRLMKMARKGGRVQLLLPAKSDVPLALYASQLLYKRLLSAGVEIWTYQPQVLHTKLVITEHAVFVGSANFNTRSLHIDYELVLRIDEPSVLAGAGRIFDDHLKHAQQIDAGDWSRQSGVWRRIKLRFAYFLMARIDPRLAALLWRRVDSVIDENERP
ncbi:MAG: phospholipase D-like domain-containing protein [Wenzhouxiangellaceae bacterium]|nr:phospholipase D-like domain-containing protein [Wenzhouxiangellaceae bacterium]